MTVDPEWLNLALFTMFPAVCGCAVVAVGLTAASRAVRDGDRTVGMRIAAAGLVLGAGIAAAPFAVFAALVTGNTFYAVDFDLHPMRFELVILAALAAMLVVRVGGYALLGAGSSR